MGYDYLLNHYNNVYVCITNLLNLKLLNKINILEVLIWEYIVVQSVEAKA